MKTIELDDFEVSLLNELLEYEELGLSQIYDAILNLGDEHKHMKEYTVDVNKQYIDKVNKLRMKFVELIDDWGG